MRRFIIALLIFLTLLVFLEPHITRANENGFVVRTGIGTFFIPSSNPIAIKVFSKNDAHIESLVKKHTDKSPEHYGIVIKNFTTGQEYSLNAEEKFKTASVYKLFVMDTIFDYAKKGKLELTQNILTNINSMITVSSNEAAWYLANLVSWDVIGNTMNKLGLENTSLNSPITSTPSDIARFLDLLHQRKLVDEAYSEKMYQTMLKQQINDRIPKLLPEGTPVAHKTGELDDVRNDVGIVTTKNNTYMIVLMSKGMKSEAEVKNTMAQISKDIYQYFEDQWTSPPSIL